MRVAIIGAGISGLTLAADLAHLAEVTVFEKSRGVGGRMATRRAGSFDFDHGTQFFTARSAAFREYLRPLIETGLVAEWSGKVVAIRAGGIGEDRAWLEPHYVAVPHMNSLCKSLAAGCAINLNTEVAPLVARDREGWTLEDTGGRALGRFDWVVSTVPPAQTRRLFVQWTADAPGFAEVEMQGCFTLMLGFNQVWDKDWIAAKIRNDSGHKHLIEWIAVNSSKPGRDSGVTSLVLHSRNDWAQEHIDDDIGVTQALIIDQLDALTGVDGREAAYSSIHRWRYALVTEPGGLVPYVDEGLQLASVGDWCSASRIEDVWLTARAFAQTFSGLLK